MTPEHREQFLATEGWQKTERGYFRKDGFQYSEDTGHVRVTHMTHTPVKFRRFPFGRQPKHDALVGWFATWDQMAGGTLTDQHRWASRAEAIRKTPGHVEEYQGLLVDFWLDIYPGNNRQGWDKYGEVMG